MLGKLYGSPEGKCYGEKLEEGKGEEECLRIIKHIGWQTLRSSGLHQLNASCDFDRSVSLDLSLMFSCFRYHCDHRRGDQCP